MRHRHHPWHNSGMNRPLVITHANCADGHCCKWLLAAAFPDAEFHDGYYGRTPPDCTGRQVVIADFSYKRPEMEAIYAVCDELVVLDHHKTAEAQLAGFGGPKATIVFNINKSGGRLTWEWLMKGMGEQFGFAHLPDPSWLVSYTEDRDLWRWHLKDSKAVNAFIRSVPKTVDEWNNLNDSYSPTETRSWTILVSAGAAILRAEQQIVDEHTKNACERTVAGHKVLSVNASTLFSEIAGTLAHDRPFGVCWFQRQDGLFQWSLRSRDSGIDVSEVAQMYGGGGHRNAAGFQTRTLVEVFGI